MLRNSVNAARETLSSGTITKSLLPSSLQVKCSGLLLLLELVDADTITGSGRERAIGIEDREGGVKIRREGGGKERIEGRGKGGSWSQEVEEYVSLW